jgi:hypothetical protein
MSICCNPGSTLPRFAESSLRIKTARAPCGLSEFDRQRLVPRLAEPDLEEQVAEVAGSPLDVRSPRAGSKFDPTVSRLSGGTFSGKRALKQTGRRYGSLSPLRMLADDSRLGVP